MLKTTFTADVVVTHPPSAPPFARALAQQISLHALTDGGRHRLGAFRGSVGVRSSSDPQKATILGTDGVIEVTQGIAATVDLEVTVDPKRRDTVTSHTKTGALGPSLAEVTALLNPALPPWFELTNAFWEAAKTVPGMPSMRLVETSGTAVKREVVLGEGPRLYQMWGSAPALARVLAGLDFFADAVFDGSLKIRGTFSEFSVVSGASMKVMWHV